MTGMIEQLPGANNMVALVQFGFKGDNAVAVATDNDGTRWSGLGQYRSAQHAR